MHAIDTGRRTPGRRWPRRAGSNEQRGGDAYCGRELRTRTSVCDIFGLIPVARSRRVERARWDRACLRYPTLF